MTGRIFDLVLAIQVRTSGITNLPYDASGTLVRPNGFGSISGVNAPRILQSVTRFTF